jgi:uncharacterized protein YidB (DUF937 family)
MGLLDQVLGGLVGGAGGGSSPVQGVLTGMLGGSGRQGGMGGLGGLVSQFRQAGLGHVADSWVGTGPNQPVSPGQLHGVLGEDRVRSMADQAGMAPTDLLSQLSRHLPNAVDGMTPDGRLPDEGTVSV